MAGSSWGNAAVGVPRRIEWANTLRGLAALSVVLGAHLLPFAEWDLIDPGASNRVVQATTTPPYQQLWHPLLEFHWNAFGVCLFFLLSGYVVTRSLGSFDRRGFAINRALRIFPTYVAAYILVIPATVGFLRAQGRTFDYSPEQVAAGVLPGLGRLLGTQTVPMWVDWTLIVELLFYLTCLLLMTALLNRWWVIPATGVSLVVAQAVLIGPLSDTVPRPLAGATSLFTESAPYVTVILVGAALSAHEHRQGGPGRLIATLAVLGISFAVMPVRILLLTDPGYRWTYLLTTLLFLAVWRWWRRREGTPATDWLADISYPLYLIHLPVGLAMLGLGQLVGLPTWLGIIAALCVVGALSWAVHVAVEQPTHELGRWLSRRRPGPSTPSDAPSARRVAVTD